MKFNLINILALFSFTLLLTAILINAFRFELFNGIRPGYAPSNFGFNFFFYLPMTFASLLIAIVVLGYLGESSSSREKHIRLGLCAPVILLWIWQFVKFCFIF